MIEYYLYIHGTIDEVKLYTYDNQRQDYQSMDMETIKRVFEFFMESDNVPKSFTNLHLDQLCTVFKLFGAQVNKVGASSAYGTRLHVQGFAEAAGLMGDLKAMGSVYKKLFPKHFIC